MGEKLIPELRFPGFEGEWERKRLGDLGEVFIGLTYSPNDVIKDNQDGYLVLRSSNIKNDALNFEDNVYVDKQIKEDLKVQKGDIIICARNGSRPLIGKNALIGFKLKRTTFGAFMMVLRTKKNKFISQLLRTDMYKNHIYRNLGATINQITSSQFKKMDFLFPFLPEQEKIGNFFYKIDRKLELQEEKIEALKEHKKGIMQKIFNREIRFRDEDGMEYPEWEKKRFDSFLSIPEKVKVSNPRIAKIITVRLHRKGIYSGVQKENLSLGSTNYFYRKQGQFIYGKQNIFNGAFGILTEEFDKSYSSADIPTLDINEEHIVAEFFDSYLGQPSIYKRLESKAIGTGSKRIHERVLLKEKINLPSLPEQSKIANFLSSLDKRIELEEEKLNEIREFKKGLMQKMFI